MTEVRFRTICEVCQAVTVVTLLNDITVHIAKDEYGTPIALTVCPEHKAQWLRMVSDFLTGRADE